MKKIGGFLLSQLFMVGLFFVLVHPTQAADAVINGSTKKALNNAAIESLYVYAENNATGVTSYGLSNAAGNYSIVVDDTGSGTAGTYTVYNYYFAYTDYDTYYIRQNQTVSLSNGETKNNINFLLDQQGKITGYVYAKDGVTPLYPASIGTTASINGLSFYGGSTSTAAGYYAVTPINTIYLDQANDGSHLATATALGYFGASQTVAVTKNSTTTANFSLTRGSSVSGKITKTDGTALVGATAVLSEVGTSRMYSAITDSAGNYSISVYDTTDYGGTAVGYYNLLATATNYISQSTGIHITADESTLSANNFSLATAGTITGTIFQADGTTALSGATITADDGYGNTTSTTSASNGTYTLSSLRASDRYTVTATKDGYVTEKAYMVSVTAGSVTSSEDFSLQTAVNFSGTVTNKDTAMAVEGATVYLYNLAKPRYTSYTADYTVTTRTDGSFVVPNIVPGKYRVRIVKSGYLTVKDRKVNLRNSVTDQNYKMTSSSGVFGKITENKKPVYNALVTVYSQQDSDVGTGSAYTDAKGFYNIPNLKSGTYLLRITTTGYADKIIQRTIKKTTTRVNIKVGPSGTVNGYLYDKDTHLPLWGYTVRVRNQAVTASTDSNGYYVLDGLAPGSYDLYTVSAYYETSTNKHVKVKSNKVTNGVNFNLEPKQ